jgi:protease PrsW
MDAAFQILLTYATVMSALVPSLLLLWYFFSRDVYPEPPSVLWATFGLGILTILPTLAIASPIDGLIEGSSVVDPYALGFLRAFATAAIPEELTKLFVLLFYSSRHREFDEPMDGVVYGVAVSLGFASFENVMYVLIGGPDLALTRAFTALPMHAGLGVIMGYYVGQARFRLGPRGRLLFCAFVVPTVIHGLYDFPLLAAVEMDGRSIVHGLLILSALPVLALEFGWAVSLTQRLRRQQLSAHDPLTGESRINWEGRELGPVTRRYREVLWRGWTSLLAGGLLASGGGMMCFGGILSVVLERDTFKDPVSLLLLWGALGVLPLAVGLFLFSRGLAKLEHRRLARATARASPPAETGGGEP